MKKFIFALILIAGIFVSCKKTWLEVIPMGNQLAITIEDFDKVMNDPALYNSSSGGWNEALLMGDEIAAEAAFFVTKPSNDFRNRYFEWRDSIYLNADATPSALSRHLTNVYEVNGVINRVMNATGGTAEQKRSLQAEAFATRAWSYWNMANYYCKPYMAATATTDPGIPLITKDDVSDPSYVRGTVQQTYDFIINDLKEALTGISTQRSSVARWSKASIEGFLGKVYLFMGKYNEALPLLKASLSDAAAAGSGSLYNYNQTLATGGAFLPIDPSRGPVNNPGNIQNDTRESVLFKVYYSGPWNGSYTGNDGLRLTPFAQSLYGPNDLRLMLYTNKNENNSLNTAGRLRKYAVRYSRWGLQLSELYLLNAECKARTNDLGGAVADVETLRINRIRTTDNSGNPISDARVPPAIAADQQALIRFIIEERIREFALEGYRWFDMRRLAGDPLYSGITFTHTLYNTDGTTTVYTLAQPNRLTLKLPRNITDGNPEMQNNP